MNDYDKTDIADLNQRIKELEAQLKDEPYLREYVMDGDTALFGNAAIKFLEAQLEKRERYWRDWNGRAANRAAQLEADNTKLEASQFVVYVSKVEMDFEGEGIIIHPNSIAGMETLIFQQKQQLDKVRELKSHSIETIVDLARCNPQMQRSKWVLFECALADDDYPTIQQALEKDNDND